MRYAVPKYRSLYYEEENAAAAGAATTAPGMP